MGEFLWNYFLVDPKYDLRDRLHFKLIFIVSKAVDSKKTVGLIISAIGYGSPLLFSFFLIIPAILLILGLIFIKWMIIDPEKSVEEYDEWHDTHA